MWPSELNKQGLGVGQQYILEAKVPRVLRSNDAEPPGGWKRFKKFTSILQSGLSHPRVTFSDVMAELQSKWQRGELESGLDGAWRKVAEGETETGRSAG